MASIHSLLERLHGGETMLSPGFLKERPAFIKDYSSDFPRVLQLFNWRKPFLAPRVLQTMLPKMHPANLVEQETLNNIKAYTLLKTLPVFLLIKSSLVRHRSPCENSSTWYPIVH